MNTPLVSVIIPAYNAAEHLAHAINSVIAQRYTPIEILVVDDGSTDHTGDVCASYGNRIRVLKQPANLGVSAARNRGIKESNGPLVAFLDADDWYLPNKLADQVALLERYPSAGAATAAHCVQLPAGEVRNPPQGSALPVGHADGVIQLFALRAQGLFVFHTSTVLIRRTSLQTVGVFREDLRIGEDVELWARIQGRFEWVFLDQVVSVYNRTSDSSVTRSTPLHRHGLDFLLTDAEITRSMRPEVRAGYRTYRQMFCLQRASLGIRHHDRAFLGQCLKLSAPPPLRLRWLALKIFSLLPDPVWRAAQTLRRNARVSS